MRWRSTAWQEAVEAHVGGEALYVLPLIRLIEAVQHGRVQHCVERLLAKDSLQVQGIGHPCPQPRGAGQLCCLYAGLCLSQGVQREIYCCDILPLGRQVDGVVAQPAAYVQDLQVR